MLRGISFSGYNFELGSRFRLWLRFAWRGLEACRPSLPPCQIQGGMMEKTQLQDCSILENKFSYEWNIFLVSNAHCQEAIHPRWIFVPVGGLFLKHMFEEWVVLWVCSLGWRSKQWSFICATQSQCWHLTTFGCECGEAEFGIGECELSWRNPTLWNWMGFD